MFDINENVTTNKPSSTTPRRTYAPGWDEKAQNRAHEIAMTLLDEGKSLPKYDHLVQNLPNMVATIRAKRADEIREQIGHSYCAVLAAAAEDNVTDFCLRLRTIAGERSYTGADPVALYLRVVHELDGSRASKAGVVVKEAIVRHRTPDELSQEMCQSGWTLEKAWQEAKTRLNPRKAMVVSNPTVTQRLKTKSLPSKPVPEIESENVSDASSDEDNVESIQPGDGAHREVESGDVDNEPSEPTSAPAGDWDPQPYLHQRGFALVGRRANGEFFIAELLNIYEARRAANTAVRRAGLRSHSAPGLSAAQPTGGKFAPQLKIRADGKLGVPLD